jgi:hypothetical protein
MFPAHTVLLDVNTKIYVVHTTNYAAPTTQCSLVYSHFISYLQTHSSATNQPSHTLSLPSHNVRDQVSLPHKIIRLRVYILRKTQEDKMERKIAVFSESRNQNIPLRNYFLSFPPFTLHFSSFPPFILHFSLFKHA